MIFLLLSQIASAGENNKVRPLINPIIGTYSYRVADNTDNYFDNESFKGLRVGGAVWSKMQIQTKGVGKGTAKYHRKNTSPLYNNSCE